MIHRPYDQLQEVGSEVVYLDQLTLDKRTGIVLKIEHLSPRVAFVYLMSPYKDENTHVDEETGASYRDIMIFDDVPNEDPSGAYRDPVLGQYGRYAG